LIFDKTPLFKDGSLFLKIKISEKEVEMKIEERVYILLIYRWLRRCLFGFQ